MPTLLFLMAILVLMMPGLLFLLPMLLLLMPILALLMAILLFQLLSLLLPMPILQYGGWPGTALRAQYGQPLAGLSRVGKKPKLQKSKAVSASVKRSIGRPRLPPGLTFSNLVRASLWQLNPLMFLAFCCILLYEADSAAILPFNLLYEADSAAILPFMLLYETDSDAMLHDFLPYDADHAAILIL